MSRGLSVNGRARWYSNVYVADDGTNKVLSVGAPPPGGTTGTIEIDVIYMPKGKAITVGQPLNVSHIEDV